ncbi:hypothetical protein FJ366_04075, partial [Candidatus Dependentiae bacterium]|nr:hypothetical protein [Candidatus Dependentiae bacterium]
MRILFLFVFLFLFVPQKSLCLVTNQQVIESLQFLSRAKKSVPGQKITPIQKIARQAYGAWQDIAEAWNFIRERKTKIHLGNAPEKLLQAFLIQLKKQHTIISNNKTKLIHLNRELPESDRTISMHLIYLLKKTQEYLSWITQEIDRVSEAIEEKKFQLTALPHSPRSHRARIMSNPWLSPSASRSRTRSRSRSTSPLIYGSRLSPISLDSEPTMPLSRPTRPTSHGLRLLPHSFDFEPTTRPTSHGTRARSASPRSPRRPVRPSSPVPFVLPASPKSHSSRSSRSHSPEPRGGAGGPSRTSSPRAPSPRSSLRDLAASVSSPLFIPRGDNIWLFPLNPSKQEGNNCGVCALMNAKAILEHLEAGNPIHTVELPGRTNCNDVRYIFNSEVALKYHGNPFGAIDDADMGIVARQLELADNQGNFKDHNKAELVYVSDSTGGLEIKKSPNWVGDVDELRTQLHSAYQDGKAIIVIFLTKGKIDG